MVSVHTSKIRGKWPSFHPYATIIMKTPKLRPGNEPNRHPSLNCYLFDALLKPKGDNDPPFTNMNIIVNYKKC
jgi:hypothetical protein